MNLENQLRLIAAELSLRYEDGEDVEWALVTIMCRFHRVEYFQGPPRNSPSDQEFIAFLSGIHDTNRLCEFLYQITILKQKIMVEHEPEIKALA